MRQLLLLFLLLCAVATPAVAQTSHSGTMSDADQKTFQRAIQDYQKGRYIPSAKQLRILAARHPSNPDIQFFLGLNAAVFLLFYPQLWGAELNAKTASLLYRWLPTWPF